MHRVKSILAESIEDETITICFPVLHPDLPIILTKSLRFINYFRRTASRHLELECTGLKSVMQGSVEDGYLGTRMFPL